MKSIKILLKENKEILEFKDEKNTLSTISDNILLYIKLHNCTISLIPISNILYILVDTHQSFTTNILH